MVRTYPPTPVMPSHHEGRARARVLCLDLSGASGQCHCKLGGLAGEARHI